jgi:hypothetical protein
MGVLLLGTLAIYVVQAACHEVTFAPLDNSLLLFLAGVVQACRLSEYPIPRQAGRNSRTSDHALPLPAAASGSCHPCATHDR